MAVSHFPRFVMDIHLSKPPGIEKIKEECHEPIVLVNERDELMEREGTIGVIDYAPAVDYTDPGEPPGRTDRALSKMVYSQSYER